MSRARNPILALACVGLLAASGLATAQGVAPYTVNGRAIAKPLTDQPGDPVKGRELAIHRQKGNCLACHTMPIPEQPDHGLIGPALIGIANRLSAGEMRLRIVDPKVVTPQTIMPSFHKVDGLHRVNKKFQGQPMLSAQEVEDIIAYLQTLK